MEVILLEKVRNLGVLGDKVTVKHGYARNFLIPSGKAIQATVNNLEIFNTRRARLEQEISKVFIEAKERAVQLTDLLVTLSAKASNEGRLFGSVGAIDIANAVSAAGIKLNKNEVKLHNGPIRQIGEYDINIQLHSEVITQIRVAIIAEK